MFGFRSCASSVLVPLLVACVAESDPPVAEEPIVGAPAATEPPRAGTGSTSGDLAGATLDVADAVVFTGSISESDPTKLGARIVLTSSAGTCSRPGVVPPGGGVFTIDVPLVDGAPAAGTYSVDRAVRPGASNVVARLDIAREDCFRTTVLVSRGTLTIEDVKEGRVRGTFAFALGRDTFTGNFDAAPCASEKPPLALRCL